MAYIKSHTGKLLSIILFGAIACFAFSTQLKDMLPQPSEAESIHILDQETHATILDIRHEGKSELLKGSILDYEGIYISYEFMVDDKKFNKTELVKKSNGNLTETLKSYALLKKANKMVVRYSSKDPRHSVIDVSTVIASF